MKSKFSFEISCATLAINAHNLGYVIQVLIEPNVIEFLKISDLRVKDLIEARISDGLNDVAIY